MILESFLPSFSANLAAMMIQSIGGQLGKKLNRPDNIEAIERCAKDASMALIREVSHGSEKEVKARLDFLKTYFSHESVSRELSGLLNEKEPDVEKLVLMFKEDLGSDDSLFANWDIESGIETLIATFLASALKEADLNRMIRANQLITQTHIQKALLEEIQKLVAFIRNGDHKITGIEAGVIKAQNVVSGTQINYTGALETDISHKNQKLRERYLRKVKKDTHILPLEGIDSEEMTCKEDNRLKLSSIYTALMTLGSSDERDEMTSQPREMKSISALKRLNTHQHMVLLGDPGSGKSTFINFIALCLAGEGLGDKTINIKLLTQPLSEDDEKKKKPQSWQHGTLLPLRIILRDYTSSDISSEKTCVETLWRFIQGELKRDDCSGFLEPMKNEFDEKGGLILFDGLDEVPEAENRRSGIRKLVEDMKALYPKCKILVTSRTYAYQKQDFRIPGLFETVLAPFTQWQVNRFIDQWYLDAVKNKGWKKENAEGKASLLKQTVKKSPRLQIFSERPLLLTLMASLHAWSGGSLPEKREELYAEAVKLLLYRWEGSKLDRTCHGDAKLLEPSLSDYLKTDKSKIRKMLDKLAYKAHSSQTDMQGTADISEKDLVYELIKVSREEKKIDLDKLASYLNHRAGLLIPRGVEVYTFPHRTFQEYLAACHLTVLDFPYKVADLVRDDPDRWREVALLAGAKAASGTSATIWQLADALCFNDPDDSDIDISDDWGALFAGQTLVEAGDLEDVHKRNFSKLKKYQRWQIKILEGNQLPAVERALAGRNLAVLGDTRKEVMCVDHMSFCLVPKGTFYMGDGEDQHLNKSLNEDFWMGRYPVTNAQYDEFVKAGGYQKKAYWGEAEKAGFWKEGRFKGKYDDFFHERAIDSGMPFNFTNHPVVRVTWYEAFAFTRWLTDLYKEKGFIPENGRIHLPSEAEWEKTSRGGRMIPESPVITSALEKGWEQKVEVIPNAMEKRSYPWGEQIDKKQANYSNTGIGTTSAIGCFSVGESSFGCMDMSGNMWEWTRSLWGKDFSKSDFVYPYFPSVEREDESADFQNCRVLRGGSFSYLTESLRCASRDRDYPDFRGYGIGFRCEFSPNSL